MTSTYIQDHFFTPRSPIEFALPNAGGGSFTQIHFLLQKPSCANALSLFANVLSLLQITLSLSAMQSSLPLNVTSHATTLPL